MSPSPQNWSPISITTAGADRVLSMDLHAGQIQGFFNVPVDHLYALPVLLDYIVKKKIADLVVVSPDAGGVERARAFAKRLQANLAIIDKRREGPNQAQIMNIIGDVQGKSVLLLDDMIDTAGTIVQGAQACLDHGARERDHGLHPCSAVRAGSGTITGVVPLPSGGDQHDSAARERVGLSEVASIVGGASAGRGHQTNP